MPKHAIIITVYVVILVVAVSIGFTNKGPQADAGHYVAMGYNLYHHATYSLSSVDVDNPEPTAYREPGYPTYLALVMRVVPSLQQMSIEDMLSSGSGAKLIRYAQLPVLVMIALLAMYLVIQITKNVMLGYMSLFMITFSPGLFFSTATIITEHFAALLVIAVSICLYRIALKKGIFNYVALGLLCAALTLSRAVFLYFIVIVTLFIGILWIRRVVDRKKALIGAIICITLYGVIVSAWMIRNHIQFNDSAISRRGGIVLQLRSDLNMMNAREYLGSFLYWVPHKYVRGELTKKVFGEDALKKGGALERLNRDLDTSIYRIDVKKWTDMMVHYGETLDHPKTDSEMKKMAIASILAHPYRHILAMLPIAWRGIFVDGSVKLGNIGILTIMLGIIYFTNLFIITGLSITRGRYDLLAIALPALYLYSVHILVTHNSPRFNMPAIPVLVMLLMYSIQMLINRFKRGRASGLITSEVRKGG